ncbi:hypothetical protein NPA08_03950 [Mycoplasmopsis citelli]|uniref:Lipoprotein n=1 Tax=Mycoplasmopsis citelli TaxID=171281 RepID=A0A449B272_9BACT|nr:hypothetical protein [Mycoplasmopsis citelli]UUD36079.1 hypothetical protein NPA08_03950 [Mycoplasmopsis citelli]VEU74624.1 Uncharacterised protein [Mycoplasmopsis citelli]
MKAIFKLLSLSTITTIPVATLISCSQDLKSYEKQNPTLNDLKSYLQVFISKVSDENLPETEKQKILQSFLQYFPTNLTKLALQYRQSKNVSELRQIPSIFDVISSNSKLDPQVKQLLELQKISLQQQIEEYISLIESSKNE